MNTIHSVSNTSLVRSSEAVAVRKSFSFRSFMIRVMLVIAIVVGGKVAWGETTCRSITFSEQGYSNNTEVSSATISASPSITVSFSSGSKYYNSGSAIRVYGGKTFTITSSSLQLGVHLDIAK